jgi:hypothetical protein
VKLHQWEVVEEESHTERLKVPGGWVYRIRDDSGSAVVFVPEPVKNQSRGQE